MRTGLGIAAALFLTPALAYAGAVKVTIKAIDAKGARDHPYGTVHADDGKDGLVLRVSLKGLPPGEHGFHVHENPDCGPKKKEGKAVAGLAAGGHYDPGRSGKHEGPKGNGHIGDLPALKTDAKGNVEAQLVAPRLKLADLKGRSLMIHEGGDNYSDNPKPLGGGGGRIACGLIKP